MNRNEKQLHIRSLEGLNSWMLLSRRMVVSSPLAFHLRCGAAQSSACLKIEFVNAQDGRHGAY